MTEKKYTIIFIKNGILLSIVLTNGQTKKAFVALLCVL